MKLIVFGFLFLTGSCLHAQSTGPLAAAEADCRDASGWVDQICLVRYEENQQSVISSLSSGIEALYRRMIQLPQMRSGHATFVSSKETFAAYREVQCRVLDDTFQTNGAGNSNLCRIALNGPRLEFLRDLYRSLLAF